MEKSISVKEKRLRRRKVILFVWGKLLGTWSWIKCSVSFKKSIIVFCLLYFVNFVEYLKIEYARLGIPFPTDVATIVVSVLIGQLALTAISSLGSRAVEWAHAKYDEYKGEDYG